MKIKTVFITICIGSQELLDYPENLPLPQIGHQVMFKRMNGIVKEVKHIIEGNVAEIRITLEN